MKMKCLRAVKKRILGCGYGGGGSGGERVREGSIGKRRSRLTHQDVRLMLEWPPRVEPAVMASPSADRRAALRELLRKRESKRASLVEPAVLGTPSYALPDGAPASSPPSWLPDGAVRLPTGVEDEVLINLTILRSNDAAAKIKALSTLAQLFEHRSGEELVEILPQWAIEYKQLLLDSNRDVRIAADATMYSLVMAVRNGLAPHLKSLIGCWQFSQFDPAAAEVAQDAHNSFQMAKDEEISRLTCENLELHDYKDKAAKLAATSERCAFDLASSQAETCQLRTQAMAKDEEIKRLKCDYKAKAAELERCAVDLTSSQAEIRQLRTQAMAKDEEIKRLKRENLELHDYRGTQEAQDNLSPDLTNTMTQESESAPATRKEKEHWTPEEEAILREGVAAQNANGNKKWIKLLEQGKDIYHPSRRPCDLGRKWRYMEGKEKKKKACAASKSATAKKRKEDPATSKPPSAKKRKRSSTTAKPSSANKRKGPPTAKQSSAKISRR